MCKPKFQFHLSGLLANDFPMSFKGNLARIYLVSVIVRICLVRAELVFAHPYIVFCQSAHGRAHTCMLAHKWNCQKVKTTFTRVRVEFQVRKHILWLCMCVHVCVWKIIWTHILKNNRSSVALIQFNRLSTNDYRKISTIFLVVYSGCFFFVLYITYILPVLI